MAAAIEAIGDRDQNKADENTRMDQLRADGAMALHAICQNFVEELNQKLSTPALALDPAEYNRAGFRDPGLNLFQINLRGRLLIIEFEATEEPISTDDFRRPYILHGSIRALNEDLLERHLVSEKELFFCPSGVRGTWHYVDSRSYRTGKLGADLLAIELERLV